MITQTYTISTIKQSTPPIVKMSQYDHGSRTITFSVVDGSGQAVVLTGKTVRVEGTRLDGHAFAEDCTVSGSTASFTDTSDMTNAPGAHPAELVIESDGDRLGTMNFVISVETAAMDENADITEEDVSLFEQLLGSIEDATGAVEAEKTAALSAIDDDKDAALLAIAQGLASGSPLVVDAVADMTDQTAVYLYSGSESGYTAGNYYFYNGSAWVSGGTYGNPTVDAAFSNSSVNPVQNKVVAAAVSELKSELSDFENRIEKTNVVFYDPSVTITGTGAYVSQELIRINASEGQKHTGYFETQTGASSSNYIFIRYYNSNNEQIAQYLSGTNNSVTGTAPAGTSKVAMVLYPAQGTAMPSGSATFTNVRFSVGATIDYEINPLIKYQRMSDAESDIDRIETNFNDVLCYNLMGDSSTDYYPVKLEAGDKVTFSKKDGSAFNSLSTLKCGFCDIGKVVRVNKNMNSGTTTITYTVPSGFDFRYLKWNEAPGDIMVNLGDTARPYIIYNPNTLAVEVGRIGDEVSEQNNQTSLKNIENGLLTLGTMLNGAIPFTKDEVKPGDIVHYHFVSPTGATTGMLRLQDVSNNNLNFYVNIDGDYTTRYYGGVGRDAANRPEEYSGYFIIPTGFDHCAVQCNNSYTINMIELYVNKYEARMASNNLEIPDYYFVDNYLPAKVTSINERLESCLAKGDAFIFITDLHLNSNQKHSPALIRYLYQHTAIRKLIYGGDLLDGGQSTEYPKTRKYTAEMREAFPCLQMFTVGNHDTFQNNPSSRITTWADTTINPFNGNSDKHYFYYDDNRSKIRYIVLNRYYTGDQNTSTGFYVDTDQCDWFENTALDMPDGYGAVIFIHNLYNFNYTVENPVMAIDIGCEEALSDVCDAYNADVSSKGEVIAILQGHTHSDRILSTNGGIPIIITTCDKNLQADPEEPDILFPEGVAERAGGTIREQAFDVVVIDRHKDANNKGTIYAIRVGCEAYNGTTVSDMGTATQERTVQYSEKF